MRLVALLLSIACAGAACNGAKRAPANPPVLAPSSAPLPPLTPIDPRARGAAYLTAIANQIQPRWAQFLEDCRLRLPADHPLNTPSLAATVEIVVTGKGTFESSLVTGSGNRDFDTAVREVLRDAAAGAPVPPLELESDDGRVHLRWVFARDRRQAGPATAQVIAIELPLVATVQRLIERGVLARAARRLSGASRGAPDRIAAAELVMIAALREGLASSDGYTREAALEAVERTKLVALARDVIPLIDAAGQIEQRVQAIRTAAALGDAAVLAKLTVGLEQELDDRPQIALAKIAALVAMDARTDAARAIRAALATPARKRAVATAVTALALVPDPKVAPQLEKWFGRGDSEVRQSVCNALPAAARDRATRIIVRGLRDPDATVRGACAVAAARHGKHADRGIVQRLAQLARDRDEAVRIHAVAALGALAPAKRPRSALVDRAPLVRAASAIGATTTDLVALAKDTEPEVRAAAIAELAERAVRDGNGTPAMRDLVLAAARDPASQVRRAAVAGIADDTLLEKLAGDDDPEVATAALTRYAARRGRAAITTQLLERLAAATPKSLERVRIARAWLLAGA